MLRPAHAVRDVGGGRERSGAAASRFEAELYVHVGPAFSGDGKAWRLELRRYRGMGGSGPSGGLSSARTSTTSTGRGSQAGVRRDTASSSTSAEPMFRNDNVTAFFAGWFLT
jgi:hypothetical protein